MNNALVIITIIFAALNVCLGVLNSNIGEVMGWLCVIILSIGNLRWK